jgi:transposase
MDVATHVVREFDISLDELHNDSTTVSFCGEYPEAESEKLLAGQMTPAITWGHSKDHRPDLKQLLYILPVKLHGTNDGGVPIFFQAASGNVVDDQAHQATWKLMAELSSHTLTTSPTSSSTTITTELTPLHRRILQLLNIPTTAYDP